MDTIKCGTYVLVKLANVKGMITCCSIRFDKVTYEITYYLGGDIRTVWTNEAEFEPIGETEALKIGFKK